MDDSVGFSLMDVKNVESPGVIDPFKEAMVPIRRKIDQSSTVGRCCEVRVGQGRLELCASWLAVLGTR